MCGILCLLNEVCYSKATLKNATDEGVARGPERTETQCFDDCVFVFHRLAINGLDDSSMQPIEIDNVTIICNGEIFNYKELYSMLGVTPATHSDCEVIIHLYKRFGIERTLELLDGEFAFVLHDPTNKQSVIHYARDPFGVRPLYLCQCTEYVIGLASELKVLNHISNGKMMIEQVEPGTYGTATKNTDNVWSLSGATTRYFRIPSLSLHIDVQDEPHTYFDRVVDTLKLAVKKRIETSERSIACLLSGGLDSSLIAALAARYYNKLNTYSIGMKGSEDLRNARLVADHIGSNHTEIILTEDDFFNAIPEVIKAIESFDTTTVRASVGNYLVAKYIRENSEDKVVLNGDGSDEVAGGYIYMLQAPSDIEFDTECRRLLSDIHYFDVLRSDRSVSSNGLEGRTPFLDKTFVSTYMQIPANVRNPRSNYNKVTKYWDAYAESVFAEHRDESIRDTIMSRPEKLLLRAAFQTRMPDLLPKSVLWRGKEAFSDGVSGTGKSWFEIIKDHLNDIVIPFRNYDSVDEHMVADTKEKMYYRSIFCDYYKACDRTIPYFWMPKFVDATDSSARTLKHYTAR